jgi:hypothetical protein
LLEESQSACWPCGGTCSGRLILTTLVHLSSGSGACVRLEVAPA